MKFFWCISYRYRTNFTNSSINFIAHLNIFQLATQQALTCTMITIETLGQGVKYAQNLQQRHQNNTRRRSVVFIVNFEHISDLVPTVNFGHVIPDWVCTLAVKTKNDEIIFKKHGTALQKDPYLFFFCIKFTSINLYF